MISHRLAVLAMSVLVASLQVAAQGLLDNATFAKQLQSWQVVAAPELAYAATDADGYKDNTSLRCTVAAAHGGGPVSQAFDCAQNTDYVITAALKSDGRINPMVRVIEVGTERVLVGVVANRHKGWVLFTERFNSGNAKELTVQILGRAPLGKKAKPVAGASGIDDVQVYTLANLPEDLRPTDLYLPPGPNIALGRPYAYKPRAKYPLSADAGDATQLTDGLLSVGYFWAQRSTVGWMRAAPVNLTIDLGEVKPIAGLAFRSAAGTAGVTFPASIHVFTSDDEKQWWLVGDLVNLSERERGAPKGGYRVHRFAVSDLNTRGRYVRLIVSYFPFAFCDEIEVYRGADELLARPPVGEPMAGTTDFVKETVVRGAIAWRLRADLAEARKAIKAAMLPAPDRAALLARADAAETAIENLPKHVPEGFQTILPLNDLHAEIYGLNALLLRARALTPLTAWTQSRWGVLAPTQAPDAPPVAPPALRVTMMSGEYRAEVLNLTNASDAPIVARVRVSGLPGANLSDYLSVRQVLFTDTSGRRPIAAALPEATRVGDAYAIDIPAGVTRQVWFSFHPTQVPAGEYAGRVTIVAPDQPETVVPLTLRIYPFTFPERPTLALGGWDYLESNGMYGATPANMPALIKALREYHVDSPWASRGVLPAGATFDEQGELAGTLDFTVWDRWVGRFPTARHYCVFMRANATPTFYGEALGTPRFNRMVGSWITAWVKHMATQGIKPAKLSLLIVDEPGKVEQTEMIVAYARAIKAAQPGVIIWLDPRYKDPAAQDPRLWAACDVLCPNAYTTARCPEPERQFYLDQRDKGTTLWLYECSGPGKGLDPYAYHRGQPWLALRFGAVGCGYWAFGSAGGNKATSWNAYDQDAVEYSPLFIGKDSVTAGKHMEGIREGVQDYEYFVMLRKRVAALKAKGVANPALAEATALLTAGPLRVTDAIIAQGGVGWARVRDRTIMDEVRIQVLDALLALKRL